MARISKPPSKYYLGFGARPALITSFGIWTARRGSNDIDILWNYLEVVREKDHWDETPARPIRITREQNLQEELSKVNIGVFASDVTGFIPVDVSWEIPEDYDPQSPLEQTFTVLGTVILEGTGARCCLLYTSYGVPQY